MGKVSSSALVIPGWVAGSSRKYQNHTTTQITPNTPAMMNETRQFDSQIPPGLNFPVRLRRRYCLNGEPFAVVEAFLPEAAAALGEVRAKQMAVYEIIEQFMGLRIGRADVGIRCARPSDQVAKELGLRPSSNVLVMERTSFSGTGQACEHMRIFIVPERYTFKLSLPGPLEIARALRPTAAVGR